MKLKHVKYIFKFGALIIIFAIVAVGAFMSYIWFCEPLCPDEVYYQNRVYIRAKSVDGCREYQIEKNDIKQMFNKLETVSSVIDEETEDVNALVCESISPSFFTNFAKKGV
ncbi:MAG: hypothetical protein SPI54_04830 [Oscillospiraceae bacterium]|jgi:hypothetical protein|nr:hypothetical protein [Oscillospiraceae bacterium]